MIAAVSCPGPESTCQSSITGRTRYDGPVRVVKDRVDGDLSGGFFAEWTARVQVSIVPGEIAACDFHPQAVPGLEHLRRGGHVDFEPVESCPASGVRGAAANCGIAPSGSRRTRAWTGHPARRRKV